MLRSASCAISSGMYEKAGVDELENLMAGLAPPLAAGEAAAAADAAALGLAEIEAAGAGLLGLAAAEAGAGGAEAGAAVPPQAASRSIAPAAMAGRVRFIRGDSLPELVRPIGQPAVQPLDHLGHENSNDHYDQDNREDILRIEAALVFLHQRAEANQRDKQLAVDHALDGPTHPQPETGHGQRQGRGQQHAAKDLRLTGSE